MEKYIESCLNSVVHQLYKNIECIIVDDCSPDESMMIVTSFLARYKGDIEFKIVRHEKNKGLSAARNSGVKVATGDYLFFLDSDDELPFDAMKLFVGYLKEYGKVDFLIGNFEVLGSLSYPPLQADIFLDSRDEILDAYIQGKWYVMAWGKLINREFFIQKNLWFKDGLLHEDELFSFRLAMFASKMITVKENVYKYVIRCNSIMTSKKEKNYWDYLWVVTENVKLACEQIAITSYGGFYSYFVSLLYIHSFAILNEKRIDVDRKKAMICEIRKLLTSIRSMRNKCSVKTWLKCCTLRAPYWVIFMSTKIHSRVREFCKC